MELFFYQDSSEHTGLILKRVVSVPYLVLAFPTASKFGTSAADPHMQDPASQHPRVDLVVAGWIIPTIPRARS
jgi:hypothetical protein